MGRKNGAVAANAAWLVGQRLFQGAVGLLVTMAVARYLGPSRYGLLRYAASLAALFTALCTLGTNDVLVHQLVLAPERQGELLGSVLGMRLLAAAGSLCAMALLAACLNPGEPVTVWATALYGAALVFQSGDCVRLWYQWQLRSRYGVWLACAATLGAALCQMGFLLAGKGVLWFAGAHSLEAGLCGALLLLSYRRLRRPGQPLRVSAACCRQVLGKSSPYILSGLMVAVYGQMDKLMLKSMLDQSAVGYYSAALSVCSLWPFVLGAVIDSAKPGILAAYRQDKAKFQKSLTRLYSVILYVSFLAAVLLGLLAKPLIWVLYGESYLPACGPLRIVAWYTAFSYLGVARSIWMVPQGKQRYEKYLAGLGAAANLVLNRLLIPAWGIAGAAWATLLTQIITNFLLGFCIPALRENSLLILRAFGLKDFLAEVKNRESQ